MDFEFSPEEQAFRKEVLDFIRHDFPNGWQGPDGEDDPRGMPFLREHCRMLAKRGWYTMAWPKEYGGLGASHMQQVIFNEEMAYHAIPAQGVGVRIVGPTVIRLGTEDLKREILPKLSSADIIMCQGYSEPETGSDLASLQTKADDRGDHFLVSGSKMWNGAHGGFDWMSTLVRSNQQAPKHRGLSFLLVDLSLPGVSIQKIPMMSGGYRSLVFFDNVKISKRYMVGEQDRGWYVQTTLLDIERSGIERPALARSILDKVTAFANDRQPDGHRPIQDPLTRSRLAEMAIEVQASLWLSYRVAWMQSHGQIPNMEASAAKLFAAELVQRVCSVGMQVMGTYGRLEPDSKWAPLHGKIQSGWQGAFSQTIAGGTSEIQRNIIATRGLGLPRS